MILSQSGETTVLQGTEPMLAMEAHCVEEKNPSQPRKERVPSSAIRRRMCNRFELVGAIPFEAPSKILDIASR